MELVLYFSLTEDTSKVMIFFWDICEIRGFLRDGSRFCGNREIGEMNVECLHTLKSTESHERGCSN